MAENQAQQSVVQTPKDVEVVEVATTTAVEELQVAQAQVDLEKLDAEKLEAEQVDTEQTTAEEDLQSLSAEELCQLLASDIENRPISELKERVEQIKVLFYKKIKSADEALRAAFVAAGGVAEEFKAETSEAEVRFKELLALYRDNRNKFTQQSEEQKEANYRAKLAIIEELKALVDSTETMGVTFAAFKDLQNRWREIGGVPLGVTKDLWENYHHHTENFYNFVKINKELRDLDLKRNLELKSDICRRAEELTELSSALTAFNELQKLHDEYREAGPVASEHREELWNRFKVASSTINKRHQEHYDKIRSEQEQNLEKKVEICVKTESFNLSELSTAKEWNDVQEQITELQKLWKTIGFAPKKDNTTIYERFRAACDNFFNAKRDFFGELKGEMATNVEAKKALCEKAEELSESSEWKEATDSLLELQKEWKSVGAVPRKHSDQLWKRFRAACDKFFERKAAHFKDSDARLSENLDAKRAILDELRALEGSETLSFDTLKEAMGRYSAVGYVPIRKKDALAKEYKEVCDRLFAALRSAEGSQRIEKFRSRVNQSRGAKSGGGAGGGEREKLVSKLRGLQNDVKVLENNIGFFSLAKSNKGANPMVEEVERKIAKAKGEIEEVIQKINILDSQE